MKIFIKLKSGISFFIPAPIALIKAGISLGTFFTSTSKVHMQEEHRKYVESVDLNELKKGMDVLKDYKGLKLLDLKSNDGTEVKIVI